MERETDLKAIQSHLEVYNAQNGNYPLLSDMNNATWRSQNMKGLDPQALIDPASKSATLTATPTAHAYAYAPTADDGTACNNNGADCTKYELTAIYQDGTHYTLDSLN